MTSPLAAAAAAPTLQAFSSATPQLTTQQLAQQHIQEDSALPSPLLRRRRRGDGLKYIGALTFFYLAALLLRRAISAARTPEEAQGSALKPCVVHSSANLQAQTLQQQQLGGLLLHTSAHRTIPGDSAQLQGRHKEPNKAISSADASAGGMSSNSLVPSKPRALVSPIPPVRSLLGLQLLLPLLARASPAATPSPPTNYLRTAGTAAFSGPPYPPIPLPAPPGASFPGDPQARSLRQEGRPTNLKLSHQVEMGNVERSSKVQIQMNNDNGNRKYPCPLPTSYMLSDCSNRSSSNSQPQDSTLLACFLRKSVGQSCRIIEGLGFGGWYVAFALPLPSTPLGTLNTKPSLLLREAATFTFAPHTKSVTRVWGLEFMVYSTSL